MEDKPGKKYAPLGADHWLLASVEEVVETLSEQEVHLTEEELGLLDEAKRGRKRTVKRRSAKRRTQRRTKRKKKKKGKKDACYYKVRSRYSVWPSAYASGALVKCRKVGAKNWGNSTKEGFESQNLLFDVLAEEIIGIIEEKKRRKRKKKRGGKRKLTQKASSESNLGDWFKRKGAKGSKGGWVDCNTCRKDKKSGRKKCKPCGRSKGEKRSRYPSCRPTPGACSQKGKGKKWGKKSKKK
jgi:hypothetical protein